MATPASNDVLNIDDDEIDQLFKDAFDSIDKCWRTTKKMRPGASVRTPTPAAEINARGWCTREKRAVRKGFPEG